MTKTIARVLDLIEAEQVNRRMKEIDPLTFLKGIYMNDELPLSVRMRAAIEVMPFIHPKLAVTAQVTERDLATLLDRRIKKYEEMKLIDHRSSAPAIADRRFNRRI